MYKFITKTENIGSFDFYNEDIIIINKKKDNPYLALLDDNLNRKVEIDEFTAYDFITNKNNIIVTNKKSSESYSLKIENSFTNIRKLDYVLHIKGCGYGETYICYGEIKEEEYYLLVNLETGNLIKKMPMELGFGFVNFLLSDDLILSKKTDIIGLFTLDNQKIWSHNINDILISDKKGEIREMKIYNDNLIIASNVGLISIKIATGTINWATRTYAASIEVVENMGYVCTSLSFYKVNLDTGAMFNYGREDSRLPDIEYNGKIYWPSGHRVVYHEGLLWYAVYDSGQSFIIAINPHDSYYEWILNIEDANKIDKIKFHKNRMYVRDVSNNLFVYEKTNIS